MEEITREWTEAREARLVVKEWPPKVEGGVPNFAL